MFDLNIEFNYDATNEYREKHEKQCDCAYCRNYYEAFKDIHPKVSLFLESFGLDVNFPLESMPLGYDEKNKKFEYMVYYPVKGEIYEEYIDLSLEELDLRLLKGSDTNNPCPNPKMQEPYILIEISNVKLPWVLDEDID